ncbi:MAG TPA: XrtA/PEP-CTERM system histidine kinase PrsK [Acidobacteriota bacterium]|nr:XrtA/PEP-CTERM system histidine kinase PrsK [Acidobacteriota bacterium]
MTIELSAALAASILSALLGAAALWLRRGSHLHQLFALGMLTFAVERTVLFLSMRSSDGTGITPLMQVGLAALALSPPLWLAFTLTFGQPEGRHRLGRGWLATLVISAAAALALLFQPGFFAAVPIFEPPHNWIIPIGFAGEVYHLILLVTSTLVIAALERTLVSTTGHARWRLKFLVLGLVGIFACRIFTASNALFYAQIDTQIEVVNSLVMMLAAVLILVGMRRSGALELDLYVSHAMLHRSIAILAVGIYLMAVALAVHLASFFDKVPHLDTILILVTLLALLAALLSDRLRLSLRRFVSRHFKRPLYDYREVWRNFTLRTAALVDRRELSRTAVKMLSETLEAHAVTIWVVSSGAARVSMDASTALTQSAGQDCTSQREPFEKLLTGVAAEEEGLDLMESSAPWCKELRQTHGDFLKEAMIRYCFPLRAQGDFLGILTVEGRVSDRPLTIEDHDLLQVICDQAAAQMLNMELSDRLRRAKEMEVFQNMSAFFIHDLKNLVSRLSLTADNLPRYFDNPEFRQDAIRVMQRSVDKIKNFCSRLSTLQKWGAAREKVDLNALLSGIAGELEGSLQVKLETDFSPLPPVILDVEQMHSVASNLLINAAQASARGSQVVLTSRLLNGVVEFAVSDQGCGMSREFIESRLFRPFQTTKKDGMGIGLYQSKLIVEAHKGHMEVESREGRGTTIRVQLPAAEERE